MGTRETERNQEQSRNKEKGTNTNTRTFIQSQWHAAAVVNDR